MVERLKLLLFCRDLQLVYLRHRLLNVVSHARILKVGDLVALELFKELDSVRNHLGLDETQVQHGTLDELGEKLNCLLMKLSGRFTDKKCKLAVPGRDVDDLVLHQQYCQIGIQQVAFFHLHEALIEQIKTKVLLQTLADNHRQNFNLRECLGRRVLKQETDFLEFVLAVVRELLEDWLTVVLWLLGFFANLVEFESQKASGDGCEFSFFFDFLENFVELEIVNGRFLLLLLV